MVALDDGSPAGLLARALALSVLVALLVALCVGMGAVEPDPAMNRYPGPDEVLADYEGSLGERAGMMGTVIETDPVMIAVGPSAVEFTVRDLETPVEAGDRLSVFGTVEPEKTIAAERSYARDPWEWTYMYAVSALGALWLAGRALWHWRFDLGRMAFAPREADDA